MLPSSLVSRWLSTRNAAHPLRLPMRALGSWADIHHIDSPSQTLAFPYKPGPGIRSHTSLVSKPHTPARLSPLSRRLPNFRLAARFCSTHTRMTAGPVPTPDPTKSDDEFRLPTDLKPTHYDITVRTDLEKLKFDGFVKVQ